MHSRTTKQFGNTFGEQDLYYRSGVVVSKRANSLKGLSSAEKTPAELPRKDPRYMMQTMPSPADYNSTPPVRSLDKRQ